MDGWTEITTNECVLTLASRGGGGWGVKISKVLEISRTAEKIDKKKFYRKNNQNM